MGYEQELYGYFFEGNHTAREVYNFRRRIYNYLSQTPEESMHAAELILKYAPRLSYGEALLALLPMIRYLNESDCAQVIMQSDYADPRSWAMSENVQFPFVASWICLQGKYICELANNESTSDHWKTNAQKYIAGKKEREAQRKSSLVNMRRFLN